MCTRTLTKESTVINIIQYIKSNVPENTDPEVARVVITHLRILIGEEISANDTAVVTINIAVKQLYKVKSYENIDFLALTNLATNIAYLWNSGFLR